MRGVEVPLGGVKVSEQAAVVLDLIAARVERVSESKVAIQQLNLGGEVRIAVREDLQADGAERKEGKEIHPLSLETHP